jgi:hypothetical protein
MSAIDLLARLKCDPLEELVKLARDPGITTEQKIRIYSELAQYKHPRRKAVEHSTEEGKEIVIRWAGSPSRSGPLGSGKMV